MKVICAWCLLEGKPSDLGEREPLDDPQLTHSIFPSHTTQVLEGFPSRSFPDAALLIVVGRNDTALYEHLTWSFARVSGVKVIVDRRMGDPPINARAYCGRAPARCNTADSPR